MAKDPQKPSPDPIAPANSAAKRILVIEDDPTTNRLIAEILSQAGFLVVAVADGKDAWFRLTPDAMPDLIITDVMLPGMDGYTFVKQLKSNPESRMIPVLAISSRKQLQASMHMVGAEGFLAKPFSHESLLTAIRKLLDHSGPVAA